MHTLCVVTAVVAADERVNLKQIIIKLSKRPVENIQLRLHVLKGSACSPMSSLRAESRSSDDAVHEIRLNTHDMHDESFATTAAPKPVVAQSHAVTDSDNIGEGR